MKRLSFILIIAMMLCLALAAGALSLTNGYEDDPNDPELICSFAPDDANDPELICNIPDANEPELICTIPDVNDPELICNIPDVNDPERG